jgi:hypothetical protein
MSLIVIEQGLITRVIDTTLVVATDATDTIGIVKAAEAARLLESDHALGTVRLHGTGIATDTVRENVLVSVRALVLVGGYLHESLHFPI